MSKFGTSQSVPRKEDMRFLTGAGPLHGGRGAGGRAARRLLPQPGGARADRRARPRATPRRAPGVLAVYAAADLDGKLENAMDFATVRNRDGSRGATPRRPMLADDRVCHAGEAIAMVVAETRRRRSTRWS